MVNIPIKTGMAIVAVICVTISIVYATIISADNSKEMPKPVELPAPTASPAAHGGYITHQEYTNNIDSYKDSRLVYFFRTGWCFVCKVVAAELKANLAAIPENTIFVEVDFDTQTELRDKYKVATQTTFVQVDSQGESVAQWHATSAKEALAGLQ